MTYKILITGASGFLGINLISRINKLRNFEIHGLVNKSKKKFKIFENIKYIKSDITNKKELKKKIDPVYDCVINFAGNIDHGDKIQTLNAHYVGLKNLIKIIDIKKIKLFIQVGSSLEYGRKKSPHKENQKCFPVSNYGKAKLLSTKFIMKKIKRYIVLRLYQVYGPHQKKNRLIPITIDSCLKDKSFACTEGSQLRDFLFVDDLNDLILKILKKKKIKSGIYNVGSSAPIKVRDIIYQIKSIIRKGNPQFGKIIMRKDESQSLFPKITKIKKTFDWVPNTNITKGLKKTITFYEK